MSTALTATSSGAATSYAIGHTVRRSTSAGLGTPHGIDRVALAVGLALIAWARRYRKPVDREAQIHAYERARFRRAAVAERERAFFSAYTRR